MFVWSIIFLIIAIIIICYRQFDTKERYELLISSDKQKIGDYVHQLTEMKKDLGELGEENTTAQKLTVLGTAKCDQPLISPLGNVPCIYYKMSVTAHWTESYVEDGKTKTKKRTEVLASEEKFTKFKIEDNTGFANIDPTDGSFEGLRKSVDKSEVSGVISNISFGNFHLNLEKIATWSDNSPVTIKYEEKVIDVDSRITVVGTLSDKMGDLIIGKHENTPLIVSTKSSDEMIKDTKSTLKIQLIVAVVFGLLSAGLIIGASLGYDQDKGTGSNYGFSGSNYDSNDNNFVPDRNWRYKVTESDTERCVNDIISLAFNHKGLIDPNLNDLARKIAAGTYVKHFVQIREEVYPDKDVFAMSSSMVKLNTDFEEKIYIHSKGKYKCDVSHLAKYKVKDFNGNVQTLPNLFSQFIVKYAHQFTEIDKSDRRLLATLVYISTISQAYFIFINAGYDLNAAGIANSNNNAQNPSSKGADVNTNVNDSTPLLDAAAKGDVNKVKALIDKGANVNAIDNSSGNTPLHLASIAGHPEVIKLLISSNADINAKNAAGATPLFMAFFYVNSIEAVKLLISSGADVNAKAEGQWSILHTAAVGTGFKNVSDATKRREILERYVNAMEMLIAAGADINARDNDGKTPLDIAIENNMSELANVLRTYMAAPAPSPTPNNNASDTEKRCDTQTISKEKHLPKWNIEIIDSSVIASMLKDAEKTHLPFLKINASDNLKQKLEDYINKNPSKLHENSQNAFTCEPGKYIRTSSNIGIQLVSCNDDEMSVVFLNLISPVDNKARVYTAKTFDYLFEDAPVITKTEETVINGERGAYVAVKYETASDGTGSEHNETDVVHYLFLGDKLRFLTDWNAFHIEESWSHEDDGTEDYSCDAKTTVLRLENSEVKPIVR